MGQPVFMVIKQDGQDLAVIENYDGPIPRVGEYVMIPAMGDYGVTMVPHDGYHSLGVRIVEYGILGRPRRAHAKVYGRRSQNYVVVHV